MSESGIWKTVEQSCFDRLKVLIRKQMSRRNLGVGSEEAGDSDALCGVSSDGCGAAGEDWKRNAELVEEMEPKCPTYHTEVFALRQLELLEKDANNEPGSGTLASIQKDLEARQVSARTKVRCRQHRLNCVLAVFDLEADSIISQLEAYEGTEVDFSSSNRVMRLKGMMKEAILTAENLGSAKREAITVELISGSCGLLRKLLSRLDEPLTDQPIGQRTALQSVQTTLFTAAETVHPSEVNDDEDAERYSKQQICEVQVTGGCGVRVPLQDNRTKAMRNDEIPSEEVDDSVTRKALAATSTSNSSSSFSTSSSFSAANSCASAGISSKSLVSPSSISFFRIPYLDACSYYAFYLLSSLLSVLSSCFRATSSERGLLLRLKLSQATPQVAHKFVSALKGFFRDTDKVKDVEHDEVKNHTCERNQGNAKGCASDDEGTAGSWQRMSPQWIRFRLESVCEGKSWNRMVHHTQGWMSSANASLSVLLSLPVKMKERGWKVLPSGYRCSGSMISIAVVCFVVYSLSIVCFDQSPTVPIRTIGRMIKWIVFDPVVDLRHRGLPPI